MKERNLVILVIGMILILPDVFKTTYQLIRGEINEIN